MVGQEGEAVDVAGVLEAVQLHAGVVVDVEVALLGHRKQHLVVQEPGRCGFSSALRDKAPPTARAPSLTVRAPSLSARAPSLTT